jgi:hypothetical protein
MGQQSNTQAVQADGLSSTKSYHSDSLIDTRWWFFID